MSATTGAPERVRTDDGTVWTRRTATRGGEALYAPEIVAAPPRLVMVTLSELGEHGVTVLPAGAVAS